MNYSDSDKELLLNNGAAVLSSVLLYGEDGTLLHTFTEDDFLVDWDYEDYRYVPEQGFIGQFVERLLDGHLMNIPDNLSLENKELELKIGVKNISTGTTNYYSYGRFIITEISKEDTTGNYAFKSSDYTKKFNVPITSTISYPCTSLELLNNVCEIAGVELDTNGECLSFCVPKDGLTAGTYYFAVTDDAGTTTNYEFELDTNVRFHDTLMLILDENKLILKTIDDDYKIDRRELIYTTVETSSGTLLNENLIGYVDFINNDFVVEDNQFEEQDSCRTVVSSIAKLGYTWARINEDNKLCLDFVKNEDVDSYDEIDTDKYYDARVTGDTVKPVNKVLIGMSQVDGENIYAEQTNDKISMNKMCGASSQDSYTGKNHIVNGDFFGGSNNWNNWGSPPTREIIYDYPSGKYVAHIKSNTGRFQGYQQMKNVTVLPNTKYTISFMAKGDYIGLGVHWLNSSGSLITQFWNGWNITNTWTKYYITWTSPNDNSLTKFNIMLGNNTTTAHECWFTDIQFEQGEIATDYEPYTGRTVGPNPDYPQPIKTMTGENTVNIIGKSVLKQGYSFDSYDNPASLALKPGSTSSRGGMNLVRNEDQSISISGTTTGDPAQVVYGIGKLGYTNWNYYKNGYILPAGTYKVVWEFSNSANVSILFWKYNENGDYIGSQTIKTINSTDTSGVGELVVDGKTVTALGLNSGQSNVVTPVTAKLMVVKGSETDLTYEPYKETSYEIDLGKNIFNGTFQQGGLDLGGNGGEGNNPLRIRTGYIPVQPNTMYTVSNYNDNIGQVGIGLYKGDKSYDTAHRINNGAWNAFPRTFTTQNDTKYIRMMFRKADETISPDGDYKIQLERGPVTTSYAPYYSVSKNLFDGSITSGRWNIVVGQTIASNNLTGYRSVNPIKIKPNTIYTASATFQDGGAYIVETDKNNVVLAISGNEAYIPIDVSVGTKKTKTITTHSSAKYLYWYIAGANAKRPTDFMLEENSVYTEYEPYDQHIELCKIGNYTDYISKNTGSNIYEPMLTCESTEILYSNCSVSLNDDEYILTATGADMYFSQVTNQGTAYNTNKGKLYSTKGANKIYTYCTNPLFTKNYITWYDENKISLGYVNIPSQSGNATPPNNAKYFTFRFGYNAGVNGTRYKNRVMISYSPITDYEPYGKNEWYEYHNTKKYIISGGENIDYISGNSDANYSQFNIKSVFDWNNTNVDDGGYLFYCNQLSYYNKAHEANKTQSGMRLWSNNSPLLVVSFPTPLLTSGSELDSYKTWLSNNNMILYTVLRTPQVRKITYQPLIDQLNAVEKMNSYEGKTYITSRGVEINAPIDITVTYLDQDTTSYTNNTDYEITGHEYEESAIQIFDNPLTHSEELRRIAINGAETLYGLTYTPMEVDSIGHPWLNGKEYMKVTNLQDDDLFFYPFDRKISYKGYLDTNISSKAENPISQKYENKDNVLDRLHHTEIDVDKANQQITSLVQEVSDTNDKMTKVTQDVNSVSTQVESINKSVDDNTKNIATIQQTIAGISVETSITGGTNLIKNSVGYFGNDFWMVNDDTEGNVKTMNDNDVKNNSISANALLLQNETIYQKITEIKNGSYYISFRYKRLLTTATCKLIINGEEFNLTSTSWKDEGKEIPVTSNNLQISLVSDKNDSCLVTDLIVSNGTSKVSWTQNANETFTDGVKIGKGITITATGSDTELSATASSIDIVNTRNRESTSTFDKYGIKTNSLESKGTIRVADKLIISRVGDQMWISTL